MKKSCQIAVSALAALVAASPFNCPPAATVTVTYRGEDSTPASRSVPVTSAPPPGSTRVTGSSGDYMTISITNVYGTQLSLSFASNAGGPAPVGNPSATILPDTSPTSYAFPTGWAGRINVGPNTNPLGSKIEGSFTGPPDIDVSYVDGYSVPITCSSEGTAVSGCNIELFKQPGITCNNQVDGPVCLNSAQDIADGPAPPFFTACAGAAYTYPNGRAGKTNRFSALLGLALIAHIKDDMHGARDCYDIALDAASHCQWDVGYAEAIIYWSKSVVMHNLGELEEAQKLNWLAGKFYQCRSYFFAGFGTLWPEIIGTWVAQQGRERIIPQQGWERTTLEQS